MRASGERSSWLALASSDWCDRTSASTRAAATLKLAATAATSSLPADRDAVVERAGAELLDAVLQRLEPARQPAHDRIGAGRDGDEQDHQHERQPEPALPGRRQNGGQRRPRRPRAAAPPGAPLGAGAAAAPALAHARPHHPQRAAVVELTAKLRAPLRPGGAGRIPTRAMRSAAALVERERQAQPLRPFAQRRGLRRRPAHRRRGSERWISSAQAPMRSLDAPTRRARAPARCWRWNSQPETTREQQQHDHHRR